MKPWRIVAAIIAAAVVASFSDWLFMGLLFHDRWSIYPEVWRTGLSENAKIGISQIVALLSSVGLVLLYAWYSPARLSAWLKIALLVWLVGPLPMLIQNGIWMKLDPWVLGAQGAGWLVRFLITAVICAFLFRPQPQPRQP